jgi:pSer/pThr/pTyr-binding forkhead associated (FHA) protein
MNKQSPDWFWEGCEAQAPLHLLVTLPGQPQVGQSVLHQPFAVVGRDRRAHLRLEDTRVGSRHAYFQVIAGQLFVIDLGSGSGTHVKGSSVRAGWVPLGERVGIGPYAVRWLKGDVPDPDAPGPGFDPRKQKQPGNAHTLLCLEFLNGKTVQQRWQVDRAITLIGTGEACKLRLRSARVSPFHCSLVWTRNGAWLVDLLSDHGVRLNGAPVTLAALEHDDRIQVGDFVIRVRYSSAAPADNRAADQKAVPGVNGQHAAAQPAAAAAPPPFPSLPTPVEAGTVREAEPPAFLGQPAAALLSSSTALRLPALTPLDPATVDPAHAALVPLMNQFGAMQEQMADQFRQTLMMMFQMFSAVHKDQMAFFQQEMDRVQQLTGELHLLRIEAAKHAPAPAPTPTPASTPAKTRPQTPPPAAAHASPPAPAAPAPPAAPATPASAAPDNAATAGVSAPAGQDIHFWLIQRMAAVQEERQNRWQKLLGLLSGKAAEEG